MHIYTNKHHSYVDEAKVLYKSASVKYNEVIKG